MGFAARLAGHWSNGRFIAVVHHLRRIPNKLGTGLLFVNLYFYIFNQQRFRAGRAMNLPDGSQVPALQASPASYMPFYMNRILPIVLFLSFLLTTISGCRERYDSELQTPDIDKAGMDHGYNLTPLGCLVYRPWNIKSEDNSDSNNLNNLVFELQKNGDLYYWFKADYLKSLNDTIILADGNKSYGHTIWKSDYLLEQKWLKNIYKKGHWAANFKDSSIQISFGDNQFLLQIIEGKYTSLGSSEMTIKQDEVKGKIRKTYLSFEHY